MLQMPRLFTIYFLCRTQVNYKTKEEAIADITKHIELFYNQRKIQKGLNFKTPNQMAEEFYRLAA